MKKSITLVIALIILSTATKAQKWTEMMQDSSANFYDIVKEFDNYWQDKSYERGKGYKAFKRWQWYMEPRVFPSGKTVLGSPGYALEQYYKFLNETTPTPTGGTKFTGGVITATTANWSALGPFGSPVNGDAGRVQAIRMHPAGTNTFFVGAAAGGLWVTTNAGVSYTTTTNQLGSLGVSDIAINPITPSIMYISTGDKDSGDTHSTGVLKSTDGGLTWVATGLVWPTSQSIRVHRLLINPVNPNILVAATTVGMYRTTDAGANWTMAQSGSFVDAELRPADPTVVHAVSSAGYIKSTDGGATYTSIVISNTLASNRLSLAVTANNNNCVYILVSNPSNGFGGLYRSTDNGATWTLRSSTPNIFDWSTNGAGAGGQGWYDIAIDASPTSSNEIIAGGVNTWKSTNGGTSWTLHTHWTGGGGKPYVHADLHCVQYVNGTTVFLGTDGGVARTTNSGTNYTTINGNMDIAQIYKMGLSANSPTRIITGHQDNGTNLLNGTTWTEVYGGDGMDCFIDWSNNNTLIESYVNGSFHRSTNGGLAWTTVTTGLTGSAAWVAPIVQSPSNANTYYCGYQHVFKSTNQGTNWTQLGSIGATLDEVKVSPSNTNIIYATSTGGVYKTINGGANWTNVTGSIPSGSASITDLAIDNTNPNKIYVSLSGYYSGNKVYASVNGGVSWTNYSTGLPNIPHNCILYVNNSPQRLYVGTDVGVYYREGSMTSWMPYNSGLPNVVIDDMEIYYPTNKLRAATYGRGVWETNVYSNPGVAPVAAFGTQFSPACINVPLQFNDYSANTPTSWSWTFSGGSPATSAIQNPTITFASAGIKTITLISTNGNGSSALYTSTISVVNIPTVAASSSSVCLGSNGIVNALTNGNMIVWSNGQQGLSIPIVAPLATVVYNYTAYLGACSAASSSTLFVDTPPQTPVVISVGGILSTTTVAQSYQWYLNGVLIPGATSSTLTPGLSGGYAVEVANGTCNDFSSSFDYTSTITGIKEAFSLNGVTIGPNPAKDYLLISFKNGENVEIEYEVQNNLGQLIVKSNFKTDNNMQAKINVQSLATGVYFLVLKNGENHTSSKFLKQ